MKEDVTLDIYHPEGYVLRASTKESINMASLVSLLKADNYDNEEMIKMAESLRGMPRNKRINIQYTMRDCRPVDEEVEEISVGELMKIIGTDYIACKPPKIYFCNSVEDMFDKIDND